MVQAIELAADSLANVKFMREKKLLSNYFAEIAKDSGACVLSVRAVASCSCEPGRPRVASPASLPYAFMGAESLFA